MFSFYLIPTIIRYLYEQAINHAIIQSFLKASININYTPIIGRDFNIKLGLLCIHDSDGLCTKKLLKLARQTQIILLILKQWKN